MAKRSKKVKAKRGKMFPTETWKNEEEVEQRNWACLEIKRKKVDESIVYRMMRFGLFAFILGKHRIRFWWLGRSSTISATTVCLTFKPNSWDFCTISEHTRIVTFFFKSDRTQISGPANIVVVFCSFIVGVSRFEMCLVWKVDVA